ncbi:unnamed protein product [Cuscuta europaea]|uniref:Uncharacterized protein n=1 Tax=Cuscuta europaea TaxID=41803 RepID=A0A9P1EHS6_CUSEU|nr:unnamed protein product [Cuscuta europaea]
MLCFLEVDIWCYLKGWLLHWAFLTH